MKIERFNQHNENFVTDLYDNPKERYKAWDFAQNNWSEEIIDSLLETRNDIESILNKVGDLGNYSMDEWIQFFQKVRKNGI
jgi:hypothetical protein